MGQRSSNPPSTIHRTITFIQPTMKIAIVVIAFALMATVESGDVMTANGMDNILTTVNNIGDIAAVGDDLDVMEGKLEGLDAKTEDIEDVRDALTTAMDAETLANTFLHENVE